MINERTRERIRKAVLENGDTQAEAAKKFNVSPTTVGTLVRDFTRPKNMFSRQYSSEAEVRQADIERAARNKQLSKERVERGVTRHSIVR